MAKFAEAVSDDVRTPCWNSFRQDRLPRSTGIFTRRDGFPIDSRGHFWLSRPCQKRIAFESRGFTFDANSTRAETKKIINFLTQSCAKAAGKSRNSLDESLPSLCFRSSFPVTGSTLNRHEIVIRVVEKVESKKPGQWPGLELNAAIVNEI